jgi:hypothetical protein
MAHRCWDESYAAVKLPWDTGEPEPLPVAFGTLAAGTISRTGCTAGVLRTGSKDRSRVEEMPKASDDGEAILVNRSPSRLMAGRQ